MKRIAFLLGSALSLGVMLPSAAPVQAQAGACNAEIMSVEQQQRSAPITANRSYIKPSTRSARPLATSSPTRLGTRMGASLGHGNSASPGGFRRSAHSVPSGSGEANPPGALPDSPGLWRYNFADTIQSDAAMRGGSSPAQVASALARARTFSQTGNYRACMDAVREAQRYLR